MRNYKRMWETLKKQAEFNWNECDGYAAEYGHDLLEDLAWIEAAEDAGELKAYSTE